MRQQQAFIGKEKMLKGGLHCHTTRSDGRDTPEDVIRYHYLFNNCNFEAFFKDF